MSKREPVQHATEGPHFRSRRVLRLGTWLPSCHYGSATFRNKPYPSPETEPSPSARPQPSWPKRWVVKKCRIRRRQRALPSGSSFAGSPRDRTRHPHAMSRGQDRDGARAIDSGSPTDLPPRASSCCRTHLGTTDRPLGGTITRATSGRSVRFRKTWEATQGHRCGALLADVSRPAEVSDR